MHGALLLSLALTTTPTPAGSVEARSGVEACPRLFDREPEADESGRLRWLSAGPHRVTVVYEGDWKAPRPLDLAELHLEATLPSGDDGRGAAIVALEDDTAGCPAGLYAVHPGEAIGATRVLAVVDDALLVERDGALRVLSADEQHRPVWSMVWVSDWSIQRAPTTAKVGRTPVRAPRRKR